MGVLIEQGWEIGSGWVFTGPGSSAPVIDYLVVAGGGAGGGGGNDATGGGGGAGGYRTDTGFTVTLGVNYTVTVGAGGAGVVNTVGSNGSPRPGDSRRQSTRRLRPWSADISRRQGRARRSGPVARGPEP